MVFKPRQKGQKLDIIINISGKSVFQCRHVRTYSLNLNFLFTKGLLPNAFCNMFQSVSERLL